MKKGLSLLLSLLMIFLLAACSGKTPPTDQTEEKKTSATTENTGNDLPQGDPNSRENIKDNLPNLNYEKAPLKIGYTLDAYDDRFGSIGVQSDGDLIAYDIFKRNAYVEDRLNCILDFIPFGETLSEWYSVNSIVYNQILVGGNECADVFMCTEHQLTSSRIYNLFVDCNNLEYIDLEKPYWWTNMMKECSLDGSTLPFLQGDLSMLNYIKSSVLYYNKTLYKNYYPDSDENALYNMVLDGTWTLDELMDLTKDIYSDLNQNNVRDNGDLFGITVGDQAAVWGEYLQFLFGCDLTLYSRQYVKKAGMEVPLIEMNNGRVRDAVEKVHNLMNQTGSFADPTTDIDNNARYFAQGNMMFYPGRFSCSMDGLLSEMTDPRGVLITPKYDASQEKYVTLVANSCAATALPVGKSDETYSMASAVLEAMACYNYKETAVTLLETLLSSKYASDSTTGKVVDMIVKSTTKSFIYANDTVTDGIVYTMSQGVKENNFTRLYQEAAEAANNNLIDYIIALYQ